MSSKSSKCLEAFKRGNKQDAERLVPQIKQPADIRTTTENTMYQVCGGTAELVSLLHTAAATHGWMNIVIE